MNDLSLSDLIHQAKDNYGNIPLPAEMAINEISLERGEELAKEAVQWLLDNKKTAPTRSHVFDALEAVENKAKQRVFEKRRKDNSRNAWQKMTIEVFRKEQAEIWVKKNMPNASDDEKYVAKMWIDELITCQHGNKLFKLPFGILMKLNLNEDCNKAGRAICRDVIELGCNNARGNDGNYDSPAFDIGQYNLRIPRVVWDSYRQNQNNNNTKQNDSDFDEAIGF